MASWISHDLKILEEEGEEQASGSSGLPPNPLFLLLTDIPQVGLGHGNNAGDVDFEVVLPNGSVCPPSDHGLPAFDAGGPRYHHASAEVGGVVYICGGKLVSGPQTGELAPTHSTQNGHSVRAYSVWCQNGFRASGDVSRGDRRASDVLDCWTTHNMFYTMRSTSYHVRSSLMCTSCPLTYVVHQTFYVLLVGWLVCGSF